jgi:uncharacterized protein YjdB
MANQTTGLGVAAKVAVAGNQNSGSVVPGLNTLTLSLSATGFPSTFQLNPSLQDAGSNPIAPGTALTLSAAANASSGTTVYTGTITGGGSNAFAGQTFVVAGFDLAANNGSFLCTASTTTTLTLQNASGVADTHAATATLQETAGDLIVYLSKTPAVATVSATGLVTAVAKGHTGVEVAYPTFSNTLGNTPAGLPLNKIYSDVNITVVV